MILLLSGLTTAFNGSYDTKTPTATCPYWTILLPLSFGEWTRDNGLNGLVH